MTPSPASGPILASFASLSHLTLHIHSVENLPSYYAIVTGLTTRTISTKLVLRPHPYFRRKLWEAVVECLPRQGWSGVATILLVDSKRELEVMPSGRDLAQSCSERGVAVEHE